ncbi:putative plant organelle RNA recognition domain-containing protein [Rosa chinensis]|uniref:Putative plant organelle RNA recognition domain-containing protein n=1 Tax=Rosa chinensis TaxID=74649 RepID=A0A2P6QE74_ROSCH|nr:protein WHAT'S THIS FACTOR 1 homolog, chloroplastic [Rosa chinensis]PRQ32461.1 putative plant organelle RNA recognition domain-containing protein [Rosa chinensis]
MLIRHPDMFYISLKGDMDSVFLREAFRDSQLIDEDRLLIIKEKLRTIIAVPRYPRRGARIPIERQTVLKEPMRHKMELLMRMIGVRDEDEDTPPDFNEDGKTLNNQPSKPINQEGYSTENEERMLVPVLPDGRPRGRW